MGLRGIRIWRCGTDRVWCKGHHGRCRGKRKINQGIIKGCNSGKFLTPSIAFLYTEKEEFGYGKGMEKIKLRNTYLELPHKQ